MLVSLFLTACAPSGGEKPHQEEGPITLTYAVLNPEAVDRDAVNQFNLFHKDVKIELKDYYTDDGSGRSATDRLTVEILTGNCPDILDLGINLRTNQQLPYRQMAEKGYLEDLWPYIENDPELGREGVMEPPLKAAEVNGGLYMLFSEVTINTLVGAERIVGDRLSWTLEDLRKSFATMPEDAAILEDCYTKPAIFYYMLGRDLDSYVDWKTGACLFDSQRFRSALEFVNSFPQDFDWSGADSHEWNQEWNSRLHDGLQMLTATFITSMQDIQVSDTLVGGRASFIGYPVEDGGSGSSFYPSKLRLGMSSACRDKEAAWEFIRQILLPQKELSGHGFPVNRADFDRWCRKKIHTSEPYPVAGYLIELHKVTDEELDRFMRLYNSITRIDLWDTYIYDTVLETVGPYFAGDKTLDETVDLVQRRVSLYVNEAR